MKSVALETALRVRCGYEKISASPSGIVAIEDEEEATKRSRKEDAW